MPPPLSSPWAPQRLARRNVALVSHAQYVLTVTAAPASRVKAAVSKAACWPWPFDLESGVRVTCDVGYLCANFGLPRPLFYRLRPDIRDIQTSDVRQKHRLMPPPIRGDSIINVCKSENPQRLQVSSPCPCGSSPCYILQNTRGTDNGCITSHDSSHSTKVLLWRRDCNVTPKWVEVSAVQIHLYAT